MATAHPAHRALPKGRFLSWLHDDEMARWGTNPDDMDPKLVSDTVRRLRPLFADKRAYFRTTVRGWENMPETPSLVVANHSGGTSIPDAWGLGVSWYRHFGMDRPLHGLAHEMVFALRSTAVPFARLGLLRANRQMALDVLTKYKRDLMVMPGGDLDTWRPWRDRYKVCFSGRKGYARLALKAGVPIVPIAHAGAHDTLIVLTDGRRIARKLNFHELFRAEIFPIHLSLPYGLGIGPFPHLPPPVRLRYRIGKPVHPPAVVPPGQEPTDAQVDAFDAAVRAALQHELDILRDEDRGMRRSVRAALGKLRRAAA